MMIRPMRGQISCQGAQGVLSKYGFWYKVNEGRVNTDPNTKYELCCQPLQLFNSVLGKEIC